MSFSRPLALGLVALALGGCSQGPRPAEAIAPAVVFELAGDTSEVLSTIPEPAARGRTGGAQSPPDENSPLVPSDTLLESSNSEGGNPAPGAPAAAAPVSPPPADSLQTLLALEDETWGVQLGAVSTRSAAFAEAQRAQRLLGLRDEQVTLTNRRGKWQFYVLAPRRDIQALLERARKFYPGGYLVRTPGRTGSW